MILDMHMLICTLVFSLWLFKVFKIFLVLIILYYLKNLTAIYLTFNLFRLWKRQILYICFNKETLFFNFSCKLYNKFFSLSQSLLKIVTCMYVICISLVQKYEKAVHVHNYRFFWKRLCFNYLISTVSKTGLFEGNLFWVDQYDPPSQSLY